MDKISRLEKILESFESAVVGFSGGIDSTLLCYFTHKVLKENFIAVTATSEIYTDKELQEAADLARQYNWKHLIIHSTEMEDSNFVSNPHDRCKWCKDIRVKELFKIAQGQGYKCILSGENVDDLKDYRPGLRHAQSLGVKSPLCEAGLSKLEIREIAKSLGLPNFNKPANPCLATRIPYGLPITRQALSMIKQAEDFLHELGYSPVRVRHHQNLARIETDINKSINLVSFHGNLISKKFKEIGYKYVSLDLEGYRTGSMNEVIETQNE